MEKPQSAAAVRMLNTLLQRMHSRITCRIPPGRRLPYSSAHRYMAAVRTPDRPSVMPRVPTAATSWSSPNPAAPITPER